MTDQRKRFGRRGEELAAGYLSEKGYRILDRNLYTRYGELDLIARKKFSGEDYLIFVEVKTRSSTRFGFPEQAVSAAKLEKMLKSAQIYLQIHPELDLPFQLDVISILLRDRDRAPEIRHYENVSL